MLLPFVLLVEGDSILLYMLIPNGLLKLDCCTLRAWCQSLASWPMGQKENPPEDRWLGLFVRFEQATKHRLLKQESKQESSLSMSQPRFGVLVEVNSETDFVALILSTGRFVCRLLRLPEVALCCKRNGSCTLV